MGLTSRPLTDSQTFRMLAALCAAAFVVSTSGTGIAPFLEIIARDLSTGLPAVGHLFSVQALTWGSTALVVGALSHRFSRRVVLLGALIALGATRLGFASSQSYAQAVAWQLVSGFGGGAFMGVVFAAVADHVPMARRGRALSAVITGQSLSLVLGVPLITLLGTFGGWRGALAIHGALCMLAALWTELAMPPDPARTSVKPHSKAPLRALLRPKLIALLVAGTTERVCFAAVAIYLPAFLQRAYGVSLATLAGALALVAAGNLIGNIAGGRIADRTRSRGRVFAIASAVTAALAIPTLMWEPGLAVSIALGFVYSFVNAAGRPALMATLSDVPAEVRGALFGVNVAMASIGWLLAGSLGAAIIAAAGFDGLGALCAAMAVLGAVLATFSLRAR
jgi:DHA1 family inner membrane transport protein